MWIGTRGGLTKRRGVRRFRRGALSAWVAACGVCLPATMVLGQGDSTARTDEPEPATLVVTNALIATMDARNPRAEALAAQGEWIVAVGTVDQIALHVGPETKVIDAGGRLVIPGFNDSHCHFRGGAELLRSLNLYGVDTIEKVLALVKERVAGAAPGEWITGSRYDHTLWGDRWPTRADLDKVAPRNPVVLRRASGHSVWVNSLALERSGITKDTANPPAGEIQIDPGTGEPTGILLESAAGLVRVPRGADISPVERHRQRKDDLLAGLRHAAELGVTSVQSSSSLEELELVRELKADGLLTLRFNGWLRLADARGLTRRGIRSGDGDLWVRVGFLKGYIDGTLGDGTAAMFEPFADREGFLGLPTMTQAELDSAVLLADRNGFQIGVHAIGDKGVHMVLDAFQRARLANGQSDRRHRIEHAQVIHPDDIRRFGLLGVIPSMQQTHCTTDMRFAEKRVGINRCKTSYAWRSLLDSGAVLAFGTDWSVEPLDPMRGVFSSVTRTNIQEMQPKTGWFPEQKLTVWESIYYYTYGSAFAEHLDHVKGTLSVGKLADMVMLDADLFAIDPERILDVKVDYTIVGGRVVWDRARQRSGS